MEASTNTKGTILLTGANGSLGAAIVSKIVSTPELAGYHGLYTVRNADSAPALKSAIAGGSSSDAHPHDLLSLELTNLAKVRETATVINARVEAGEIPPIRALILNAGYLEFTEQTWTDDGFDMSFASAYLGHWLLTLLLLKNMDRKHGRIVVVASESHDPHLPKNSMAYGDEKFRTLINDTTEPIARGTWSTTEEDPSFRGGYRRYGASKLCMNLMIGELQRRLDDDPVLSNICILGVDPGSMPGAIARRGPWMIRVFTFQLIMSWLAPIAARFQENGAWRTVTVAAPNILAGALESTPPLGEQPKGMYLYGSRIETMGAEAQDSEKQGLLWRETIGYTGLKEGETILQNWN